MQPIPLARCVFLGPLVDLLNEVGAPADQMLAKFHLPAHARERPNDYFPLLPALRFATEAEVSQGITDVGFRVVRRLSFAHLNDGFRASVRHCPTLLAALQQWCKFIQFEDTFVRFWLERHEESLRCCSLISGTEGMPHLEHTQWIQNLMTVAVVREFAGPKWAPETIAFEARYTPSAETRALWPHTRFFFGQKASWIDVPVSLLSLPNRAPTAPLNSSDSEFRSINTDAVTALKLMLPSYLERAPTIAEMAEIVGTSVRSLQRALGRIGLTLLASP